MRFAKWFHMKYSLETKYYLLISFDLIALKLLTNKMGHSFGYQILFYIFWILLPCQWYSYDIIINPQLMMSALLGFSVPPSVFCSLLCLALIRRHWKDTSFGSAALRDNHQPLGSKGKILYSSGLKVQLISK